MPFLNQKQLSLLYSSGLSMMDIANKHKVSLHKVAYWMNKHSIARRSRSEATYIKKHPKGNPFKISSMSCPEEKELLTLGVALYLGEGSKTQNGVRLANSDPKNN